MTATKLETDVAVIGAGPAGSSLAGFLRLAGVRVCVVEREVFPRFHIGESLLTMSMPRLAKLGVDLSQAPYALKKPGAFFLHEPSGESLRIDFAHALEGTYPYAYQVERQYFDHALALRAEQLGADVRYGAEVTRWEEHDGGVELEGDFGSVAARIVIDATGQQALFGRRRHTIEQLDRFGRCASFTTFGQVTSPTARRCVGNGDITIALVDVGWLWLIPLPDDRVSVGLVERIPKAGTTAESVLMEMLTGSEFFRDFFAGAKRTQPFRRITNWSYYNVDSSSNRCAALGDARAFLDPIFSSGVTIAVATAELLADEIVRALGGDERLQLEAYRTTCERGYTTFDRLIERFYRPEWVRNVFFASVRDDRLVREFTALLAGDVWRNDNSMQELLLKSQPRGTRAGSAAPH